MPTPEKGLYRVSMHHKYCVPKVLCAVCVSVLSLPTLGKCIDNCWPACPNLQLLSFNNILLPSKCAFIMFIGTNTV